MYAADDHFDAATREDGPPGDAALEQRRTTAETPGTRAVTVDVERHGTITTVGDEDGDETERLMLEILGFVLFLGVAGFLLFLPSIAARWWLEKNPPDEGDDDRTESP